MKQNNDEYDDTDLSIPYEEVLKRMGDRSYQLSKEHRRNIKTIEDELKSGTKINKKQLEAYNDYLYDLSFELKKILEFEREDGLSNIPLEQHLRKVINLLGEVNTLLDKE